MYAVGTDALLHVYGDPSPRLRRSLDERPSIRASAGAGGVPDLYAVDEDDAGIWVLEERLHGRAPDVTTVGTWFPTVTRWLVATAGTPGPPLGDTAYAAAHHEEAIARSPARLQSAVAKAAMALADLPARTLHGDAQPKNFVIGRAGVGLIDWEGAWRSGLPGLDLVYLGIMASRSTPDPSVIAALAKGVDVPGRPLLDALSQIGVDEERRAPTLLLMMATWSLAEARRLERSSAASDAAHPFQDLFVHHGDLLL